MLSLQQVILEGLLKFTVFLCKPEKFFQYTRIPSSSEGSLVLPVYTQALDHHLSLTIIFPIIVWAQTDKNAFDFPTLQI